MKYVIFLLLFPFVFLLWAGSLKADLLGDTIQFNYVFPDQNTAIFEESLVVVEGASDEVGFEVAGQTFFVNPESNFIEFRVEFSPGLQFDSVDFNGAVISDLDFANGQLLVDFTFESDFVGFSEDRISFTADSLAVNFESLESPTGNNFVRVNLVTVPEPNSVLLVAISTLLFHFRRLRQC